ncbi:U4/U6.U5 tri-snRNP-associated protein 1 [Vanessa tameamea]|uniref:U4/U6.U5 tri-snRNP-associated protein 1 n=1 Tax=Vanessa tameamea TaxID=334116 RepID=A0A8B8IYN5_VANTA
MGSKKHKKESKKRKHRSRSRSPLDGEEREKKRHKKHRDRKKDRSPDVEEVPVDSHLPPDNGVSSGSRSSSLSVRDPRDSKPREDAYRDNSQESERAPSPAAAGSSAQESLSIEETNKLRAKLGLKPLEVAEKQAEDGKIKDDLGEFYHKPAANLSQQRAADKLRERLELRREKRQLENKLQTTLLADGSEDEDASGWIKKSRDLEKQKREAAKRAAMLDELDEEFGVGALLADDRRESRERAYAPTQLRGLRVAHDFAALPDERETVLTLADKDVLAEDSEDVLVNVNIVDDEKYKKNIEERKKARAGYRAYDEEAELATALGLERSVLSKYDDEIDADAKLRSRGFRLGDQAALEAERAREAMRAERLAGGPDKRLESLQLPELRIASDYLDEEEMQIKFKKVKRKGKIRKKPKQEPIDVDEHEAGTAPLETDDTEVKPEQLWAADEDEVEVDTELQAALARARRLRLAERAEHKAEVDEILQQPKEEPPEVDASDASAMVLDATAEFCRTLGDIPTYGLAGNRDHLAEIMDFERDEVEAEPEVDTNSGAWSRVDVDSEKPADIAAGAAGGLEAEPALGAGVAGALRLALSKGYLERAGAAPAPRPRTAAALTAHHYSIEDKTYGEDDKHGRRERGGHSGPLSEFREKNNFRPNIKLEYVDDDGRPLCPKEAFRYLSHKFHGKGPGKNKQEKRIKKAVQEGLMKKMSSTDTPLGTLQMLQQKQRETQSPFVVLSGAKRDANN